VSKGHPNAEDIIKNVTKEYPQQAAWHLVQLLNSTNPDGLSLAPDRMNFRDFSERTAII
jgi:hypothetical protein